MFCGQSDLASLARVHSSFQEDAERAIYQALFIRIDCDSNESTCLATLSTNLQKASMVKSLHIELVQRSDENQIPTTWPFNLDALYNMRELSDLRIQLSCKDNHLLGLINDVLRSVRLKLASACNMILTMPFRSKRFQLHTLYINESADLAGIIDNQPRLQTLALYRFGPRTRPFLYTSRCLGPTNAPSTYPLIFELERQTLGFNVLTIFPAFYSNPSAMCRTIANSFANTLARKEWITTVEIYLKDFSNMESIYSITEAVALHLPGFGDLEFWIEHPTSQVVSLV